MKIKEYFLANKLSFNMLFTNWNNESIKNKKLLSLNTVSKFPINIKTIKKFSNNIILKFVIEKLL